MAAGNDHVEMDVDKVFLDDEAMGRLDGPKEFVLASRDDVL